MLLVTATIINWSKINCHWNWLSPSYSTRYNKYFCHYTSFNCHLQISTFKWKCFCWWSKCWYVFNARFLVGNCYTHQYINVLNTYSAIMTTNASIQLLFNADVTMFSILHTYYFQHINFLKYHNISLHYFVFV